jgi:hypothetical protein
MEVCITFENWEKYQAESRRLKNPTWLRLENKTYHGKAWHKLNHTQGEGSAFFFLLMFVSQNGNESGQINSDTEILAQLSRLPEKVIVSAIRVLMECGAVSCEQLQPEIVLIPEVSGDFRKFPEISRLPNITLPYPTRPNTTQQDHAICQSPLHPLAQIWNDESKNLPKVSKVEAGRLKHAQARWKDNPDPEYWRGVVKHVVASPFLRGEDGGWKANFDWLIKPGNATKVLEGVYSGQRGGRKQTFSEAREASHLELYAKIDAGEI